jgi:hypothetical protein
MNYSTMMLACDDMRSLVLSSSLYRHCTFSTTFLPSLSGFLVDGLPFASIMKSVSSVILSPKAESKSYVVWQFNLVEGPDRYLCEITQSLGRGDEDVGVLVNEPPRGL